MKKKNKHCRADEDSPWLIHHIWTSHTEGLDLIIEIFADEQELQMEPNESVQLVVVNTHDQ